MSAIIYPIPTHWAWGPDGWLGARGFRYRYYNSCRFPLFTTDMLNVHVSVMNDIGVSRGNVNLT